MKTKLVITALHLRIGGVELMICSLANAFVEQGMEVEIVCTYNLGEIAYDLDPRVKVRYLTSCRPNKAEIKWAIKHKNPFRLVKEGFVAIKTIILKRLSMIKALKTIRADIFISTRNEHSVLLSKINPSGIKIAQLHHDHHFNKKLIRDFQERYTHIDAFVLLTDQLRLEVELMLKNKNKHTKVVTIPNFLTYPLATTIEFASKKKQIVSVGRLHSDKGFDRLIEIYAKLANLYPDWQFIIVGEGELKNQLSQQIESCHCKNQIILTGALDYQATLKTIKESRLYAMTSVSEAYPMVLLEACSMATPIVSYDVRVGPRAIIQPEITGFLIEDNNQAAFIEACQVLMDDDHLNQQFSQNAFSFSKTTLQAEVMTRWIDLINSLLLK